MNLNSELVVTATVSFLLGWTFKNNNLIQLIRRSRNRTPSSKLLKLAIIVRTDLSMSRVGDSGVGKTSLIHLICHNEAIVSPSWTVGCSVEVKLHEFKEGLPQQKTYFIELWDIGGSSNHQNSRTIFYNPVHGIILVHDLTNRKSQQNLQKWLSEILNYEAGGKVTRSFDDFDSEQFVGSTQIPILVVGTKLDLSGGLRSQKMGTFAEECGADEILMDCRQPSALAAGSSSAVKLSRFFDKVVEKKFNAKSPLSPYSDKRRGKIAAQCSHAAVINYKLGMNICPEIIKEWESVNQPKIVLRTKSGEEGLLELEKKAKKAGLITSVIRDAGLTQVPSMTATVLAIGPDHSGKINKITSDLGLL